MDAANPPAAVVTFDQVVAALRDVRACRPAGLCPPGPPATEAAEAARVKLAKLLKSAGVDTDRLQRMVTLDEVLRALREAHVQIKSSSERRASLRGRDRDSGR